MREQKHHLNLTGRCRLIRNNVGVDKIMGVRFGLGVGSPDLVGVLRNGICFCIETKVPGGRIRPEQAAWFRAAYKFGVRGGVARSLAGAFQLLADAERGPMGPELVDYP
jgi:hypothetical protein